MSVYNRSTENSIDTKETFDFTVATDQKVNVRNEEKGTIYTVTTSTDGSTALACTCPDYKYRHEGKVGSLCKHALAVDRNIDSIFADQDDVEDDTERVTGPYRGYDKYGNFDHTFWRCETCSAEATHKRALSECCE